MSEGTITPQRALELANFFKVSLHEMGLGANGILVSARKIEELEPILRHYAEIMQVEAVGSFDVFKEPGMDVYAQVLPKYADERTVQLIIKPKPLELK